MSEVIDTNLPSVKLLEAIQESADELFRSVQLARRYLEELLRLEAQLKDAKRCTNPGDVENQGRISALEHQIPDTACTLKRHYNRIRKVLDNFPELKRVFSVPEKRLSDDFNDLFQVEGLNLPG